MASFLIGESQARAIACVIAAIKALEEQHRSSRNRTSKGKEAAALRG
jgi:hypothetical protein